MVNLWLVCFISNLPGPPKITLDLGTLQLYPISKTLCSEFNSNKDVIFELHTRKNPNNFQKLKLNDDASVEKSDIDFEKPTVIFFHGYLESSKSPDSVKIKDSFLKKGDYNVILANSERLFAGPYYFDAAMNTKPLGKYSASFIDYLVTKGLKLSKLHIVGMSLGAQVAGYIAKNLKSGKIARITGLDPAGPLFEFSSKSDRLSKGDAEFVDVIHTNGGIFGTNFASGDADIWFNGGHFQPGCGPVSTLKRKPGSIGELVFCHHNQAWRVYVKALMKPNEYLAVKCDSHRNYKKGRCDGNHKTYVGEDVDTTARGNYYIDTGVTAVDV